MANGFTALMLTPAAKAAILTAFPAMFSKVVADHVTVAFNVPATADMPTASTVDVVGVSFDDGVQAVVVAVNGSTKRADGSTFHVTVSLADGRKAKDSNAVIAAHGFTPVTPFTVDVTPKFVPFK